MPLTLCSEGAGTWDDGLETQPTHGSGVAENNRLVSVADRDDFELPQCLASTREIAACVSNNASSIIRKR
eukprot:m.50478 g.50478  ORF g.50478 m.50478 type:complete len:70 (-) comp16316_c0_seq3:17-226(-)